MMKLPRDLSLPFFAYGIFRRGGLGYLRFEKLIELVHDNCVASGRLFVRDGLPLFEPIDDHYEEVRGSLIYFKAKSEKLAYEQIAELEPDKQYYWSDKPIEVKFYGGVAEGRLETANVLSGKKITKGAYPFDQTEWSSENDPFFTDALEVIAENSEDEFRLGPDDLKPLFRLQMRYLLLWAAIERYLTLRYSLRGKVMDNINKMAQDPDNVFRNELVNRVKRDPKNADDKRVVFRTQDPSEKATLDPNDPSMAIDYYYQVRCNITHRGKDAHQDFRMLNTSLKELSGIFDAVLKAAFEKSKNMKQTTNSVLE